MSNFYITLPSNVSNNVFENNTMSNYTTVLAQPLVFDGNHEVALVQVSYSSKMFINIGKIIIKNFYETYYSGIKSNDIEIQLNISNQKPIEDVFNQINYFIQMKISAIHCSVRYLQYHGLSILNTNAEFIKETDYLNPIETEFYNSRYETHKNINIYFDPSDLSTFRIMNLFYKRLKGIQKKTEIDKTIMIELSDDELYDLIKLNKDKTFDFIPVYLELFELYKDNWIDGKFEMSEKVIKYFMSLEHITSFNNDLKIKDYIISYKREFPELSINENKLSIKSNDLKIFVSGKIASVLVNKFVPNDDEIYLNPNKFYNISSYSFKNQYIAIYSDIIEEQYVGNKLNQILKIIPIYNENNYDIVTNYENPHYCKLKSNYISTINIRLLDLNGENIKFESGTSFVIVKLHIRKIE